MIDANRGGLNPARSLKFFIGAARENIVIHFLLIAQWVTSGTKDRRGCEKCRPTQAGRSTAKKVEHSHSPCSAGVVIHPTTIPTEDSTCLLRGTTLCGRSTKAVSASSQLQENQGAEEVFNFRTCSYFQSFRPLLQAANEVPFAKLPNPLGAAIASPRFRHMNVSFVVFAGRVETAVL